jgi:hypothetical protein
MVEEDEFEVEVDEGELLLVLEDAYLPDLDLEEELLELHDQPGKQLVLLMGGDEECEGMDSAEESGFVRWVLGEVVNDGHLVVDAAEGEEALETFEVDYREFAVLPLSTISDVLNLQVLGRAVDQSTKTRLEGDVLLGEEEESLELEGEDMVQWVAADELVTCLHEVWLLPCQLETPLEQIESVVLERPELL